MQVSYWTPEYEVHELKKLREDDSIEFLLLSTEIKRTHQPEDEQTAREISRELDGHCLALTQAVGYVNARRIRLTEFLDAFRNNFAKARQYAESLVLRASIDRQEARSITTTFFTTFEKLTPTTRVWLEAFAWLAPEP